MTLYQPENPGGGRYCTLSTVHNPANPQRTIVVRDLGCYRSRAKAGQAALTEYNALASSPYMLGVEVSGSMKHGYSYTHSGLVCSVRVYERDEHGDVLLGY